MSVTTRAEAPRQPIQEYRCKQCRRYLLSSDAPYGQAHVTCPRCGTRNALYLGGYQRRDEAVVGQFD